MQPSPSERSHQAPADLVNTPGRTLYTALWRRRSRIAEGALLGALTGMIAWQLGLMQMLPPPLSRDIVLLPAFTGILLALSRGRRLLRGIAGTALAALLLIGYTPIVSALLPPLERSDPLVPVPAVVVLSTSAHKDGTLDAPGQERAIQGYLLMRQGYGRHLVLTRNIPRIGDESPAIRAQTQQLGLDFPTDAVGPVSNTHDEALAVARLARDRGWKRIILVTHPWHMRRARGVFLKAGLDVLCSPCAGGAYDPRDLASPGGRFPAFRDWMHETIGFLAYRLHGWL